MDVISLSSESGTEEETDIQFVGSYKEDREDAVPFIRAELLAVTPVLIDITGHHLSRLRTRPPRRSKRRQSSSIEVIDLNTTSLPSNLSNSETQLHRKAAESSISPLTKSSRTVDLEDVIYVDPDDENNPQSPISVSTGKYGCSTDQYSSVHSNLEEMNIEKMAGHMHPSEQFENRVQEHSYALNNPHKFHTSTQTLQEKLEELQNTKTTQEKFLSPTDCSADLHKEDDEKLDPPQNWPDKAPSPFSLDSPYYCPSEVDDVIFSEGSDIGDTEELLSTTCNFSSVQQTESTSKMTVEMTDLQEKGPTCKSPASQAQSKFSSSGGASPTSSLPCGQPYSPTSTEILAGDSPDTLASAPSLAMESPPSTPCQSRQTSPLPSPSTTEKTLNRKGSSESPPSCQWTRSGRVEDYIGSNEGSDHSHTRQHISLVQFNKLKHLIGGGHQKLPENDEEEEEDHGPAEPLCRQGLSLVYSTKEENYPEGTLQLLSDFIQPRFYPPVDITAHLLRGILLDPQCTEVLALEAYNLLMRTQKYHPADVSSVPWDWELLSSVMVEQDVASGLRSEVQCLLFQYVLQVLEDDFQFRITMLQLHLSIAKAMLSCHQKFRQVRDVMNWLLDAARQSFHNLEDDANQKREKNCHLKMVLIMQRMLLLAMEVDRTPTCSSNKLSQELCNSLNSTAPCRQLRFLLLSTLESNLLRCKLLELLLDQACSQKKPLPMSLKLLLHFLQTSTPAPDPSDGTERWRKWDELLKLVWMLMLSYEEVVTGHLRFSITERFTLTRVPMWTANDQVTRAAVQEAVEAFLSRAVTDLGHALPTQVQESLSQLQEHLLSISLC